MSALMFDQQHGRSRPPFLTRLLPEWRGIVLIGLAFLIGAAGSAGLRAGPPLGVNGDWDYVDLVKQINWYGSVAVDDNGWPTADLPYVTLFDVRKDMPWNGPDPDGVPENIAGTYSVSFNGQATFLMSGGGYVENQSYNTATNTTTLDLVIDPFSWIIQISLTNTRRTANSPVGSGFTNLQIPRLGYPLNYPQLFTDQTLAAYSPGFAANRFIGPDDVNGYDTYTCAALSPSSTAVSDSVCGSEPDKVLVTTRWADRVQATDASPGPLGLPQNNINGHQSHGLPWEHMIMFANQTNTDMWLHVPISADDDYVTQLATLVKSGNGYTPGLNANLHVYVEYGNEVWNTGFDNYYWNDIQATAAGISDLQEYVRRSIQIAKLFEDVYGAPAMKTTVRPVVLWQYTNELSMFNALAWAEQPAQSAALGITKVSDVLYGAGQAGYNNPSDTSSVADIMATMWTDGSDGIRWNFIGWQAVCSYLGLQQVAYESGPSLNGAGSESGSWPPPVGDHLGAAATRDPRITAVEENFYLNDYFAVGGQLINFFAMRGSVSPWGDWLLVENYSSLNFNTPKMQGVRAVLAAPAPKLTAGHVLPWSVGQSVSIDASQRTPDPWISDATPLAATNINSSSNPSNLYLLRALTPGTYSIQVYGQGASSQASLQIAVDDVTLGTVLLPTVANGWSSSVAVTLTTGVHGLLVANGGTDNNNLPAGRSDIQITLTAGGGAGDVPSAPTNFSAPSVASGTVNLRWAPVASASIYHVKRGTVYSGPYTEVGTTTAPAITYTDTSSLTDGTLYYYVVTAENALGQSANSPVIYASPGPAAPPAAPATLTAVAGAGALGYESSASTTGMVQLTWTASPAAVTYSLLRSTTSGSGYTAVATQRATSYIDSNLALGQTYYYVVQAINGDSQVSGNSPVASATPMQNAPAQVTGLVATPGNRQIALSWTPITLLCPAFSPAQYNVKRSESSGGPYTVIAQPSWDNLVDTTALPGRTYYYVVSATNGVEGPNSAQVSAAACSGAPMRGPRELPQPLDIINRELGRCGSEMSAPGKTSPAAQE
ncbi:MAG: fibronectin type III domain-containing protein [Bryobacteraceae bacterium]